MKKLLYFILKVVAFIVLSLTGGAILAHYTNIADAGRENDVWVDRLGTYVTSVFDEGRNVLIRGANKYLNFGTTSGTSGYGFRDNGGTMQFKDSGGSWAAFGAGGGSGTVTSVDMTVPTGLTIAGNPVTTSGTLALSLTAGYNIPLTASTTNWNTAYNWGNHASAGYLTSASIDTSAELDTIVTDDTGSGALVFATSPVLVTPNLGTPSAVVLTSGTGLPISTGLTGAGTGVLTALGVNVGSAGAFVVNGGALGTPSSGTVTNLTGTASININGTVGATTPTTGVFTTVTGNTSVTTPIFSSNNADPADAGILRLGNAEIIGWEASPASTDITLTVNSSEQFVFSNDVSIPDNAYAAGWNASLLVPTRNAVYDIIETLGRIAGQVWTGVHDFGGATSLEIPNGTAPTVDATGECAWDTTDDQLKCADGGNTARVVAHDEFRVVSVTIASTSLAFTSGQTLAALGHKDGLEITQYRCYVVGGTSKVLNLTDGTNDTETITCATTMTSDTDVATNDTFTADELGYIEFGATTGTVNYVHFEAYARITGE